MIFIFTFSTSYNYLLGLNAKIPFLEHSKYVVLCCMFKYVVKLDFVVIGLPNNSSLF